MIRRALPLLLLLLLIMYVAHNPHAAAGTVHHVADWLGRTFDGLGEFANSVVS